MGERKVVYGDNWDGVLYPADGSKKKIMIVMSGSEGRLEHAEKLAKFLADNNVPALAFALGMFIPLELNTPLLIGGAINWYVGSRSKDQALNNARLEKGTLLSSGFIAGGALMGVVSAALRFAGVDLYQAD